MNELILSIIYGILGSIARLLVSFLKSYKSNGRINIGKFGFYTIVVLLAGAFSGIVLGSGKQLSFLGGYAGLDLLDGYYKSFKRKKIKFK